MKKKKSVELRHGEKNRGAEERKTARSMEMDTGLCFSKSKIEPAK